MRRSRNYVTGGRCPSKARVNGKTVIITGANTGIGKETAQELARRGGRIIMGCRDMEKCEAAAKEIRGNTLNPHVYACHLDLASMKSIREFAERIKEKEKRVDVLINNAGVMRCPAWKTEDGFDMQFGVNHLGHFLLTNLLLDRLKESAPSRVINLTSLAYVVGKMDFEDLNWEKKKFDTKQAYCQSKLANVLFTRELAKRLQGKSSGVCGREYSFYCSFLFRFLQVEPKVGIHFEVDAFEWKIVLSTMLLYVTGTGVTVNAVHPGVVSTQLGRHTGLHQSQLSTTVLSPLFSLLIKNPELGAQPSIYLAVAEQLEGVTGRYYDVLTEKEPAPQATDEEAARRLWEISSRMVGLKEDDGQTGNSCHANLPAQSQQTHGQNPGPVVGAVGL
ncbi:retinol dehydrogenase 13-like isoform X2 [Vanacampus margaritifer]